jgi:hypothetical protein
MCKNSKLQTCNHLQSLLLGAVCALTAFTHHMLGVKPPHCFSPPSNMLLLPLFHLCLLLMVCLCIRLCACSDQQPEWPPLELLDA